MREETRDTINLDGLRCPACGYDLTGNCTGRCSECGRAIDRMHLLRLRSEPVRTYRFGAILAAVVFPFLGIPALIHSIRCASAAAKSRLIEAHERSDRARAGVIGASISFLLLLIIVAAFETVRAAL